MDTFIGSVYSIWCNSSKTFNSKGYSDIQISYGGAIDG